jgi:predicted phosphodiesterase
MGEIRVIYVTGDTHGEMQRFRASELRRLGKGDTLIICGDFGFLWDGGEQEEKNLQKIGKMKYNVLFLDGTHENFDLLGKYPVEEWNGGKVRHISGGLYHLMRGQVYSLGGRKLFTFGGGESAEKQIRMEAKKWWPSEMPSLEEMREGVDNLRANDFQVDYVFTHEPPPECRFCARHDENGEPEPAGGLLWSGDEADKIQKMVLWFPAYRPEDYIQELRRVQRRRPGGGRR